jgi:hypothetical protein
MIGLFYDRRHRTDSPVRSDAPYHRRRRIHHRGTGGSVEQPPSTLPAQPHPPANGRPSITLNPCLLPVDASTMKPASDPRRLLQAIVQTQLPSTFGRLVVFSTGVGTTMIHTDSAQRSPDTRTIPTLSGHRRPPSARRNGSPHLAVSSGLEPVSGMASWAMRLIAAITMR